MPANKPYEFDIISVIISCNQEIFIQKTIESVLSQNLSYSHHIVIIDDASTDSSIDIIKSYKEKYPQLISTLIQEKNIGIEKVITEFYNFVKNRSKYLTIIEGDDYWNNTLKLQKQIDFLEQNKDYAGCFHDAIIKSTNQETGTPELAKTQSHEEHKTYSQFNRYLSDFYSWHLMQRNIIPTASLVFYNNSLNDIIGKFSKITLSLNWGFHLFLIRKSKFKYFNETWSVYNDHPEGFSKKFEYNKFKISNVNILKLLYKFKFYAWYDIDLNQAIVKEYKQIIFNPATKKQSFGFLLNYILKYVFRSFLVLHLEIIYSINQFFKRNNNL
jgi:glycosyltransferase involved in cell wall biosynthesis